MGENNGSCVAKAGGLDSMLTSAKRSVMFYWGNTITYVKTVDTRHKYF